MSKHFNYMFAEADKGFFTKVAGQVEAHSDSREAALQRDLEADIQLLKESGPVGDGFAFTKRAFAYLEMLADESNPYLDFLPTVFEKVASAAIHTDVMAMLPGLDKEAKKQLLSDAMELVKKADEQKLAGGGLAFLKGLGEAGKAAGGLAHSGAANMARKGIRGLEDARLLAAQRGASKLQHGASEARAAVSEAKGPISKAFREGKAKSLENSAQSAAATRDKKLTNMVGSRAKKLVPDVGGNVQKPFGAAAKPAEAKVEAPKTKTEAPRTEVAGAKSPTGGADVAGAKKGGGMIDTFKKMRTQGWHSLDELEKQKMISGGLGVGLAANTLMN